MSRKGALIRAAARIADDAANERPCQSTRRELRAVAKLLGVPTEGFVRPPKGFKNRGRLAGHLSFKGRYGSYRGFAPPATLAIRIFRFMLSRRVRRAWVAKRNKELLDATA